MKILKIDHIGVAIDSINLAKDFWSDVLGFDFSEIETVEEQQVTTSFFPVGESKIELLESTTSDGPIAKYINKKGQGIQHIAFKVENIDNSIAELMEKGINLIDKKPRNGAGGAKIAFIHPKETNGILIELCEHQ